MQRGGAMKNSHPGIIALADGTVYQGTSVGVLGSLCGELVFNTSQTGYQEILTDPSYYGQIIVFTQPHIGNVGINLADMESKQVHASGIIMHSLSSIASNWRSELTLADFLKKEQELAISGIHTRALTHHLRQFGSQTACLMTGEIDTEQALQHARKRPGLIGKNLTSAVSTSEPYLWQKSDGSNLHVVVYDFGVKNTILNCLAKHDCQITVVPASTSAADVLALNPSGIVLSNGPGDPAACHSIIATIQTILGHAIPTMGICLGHQLLALASGATTKNMVFGHHGANHPVQCLATGVVSISSQNHGFVVADSNLPACLHITHRSLFDGTIAGFKRVDIPAFGFQGHPEGGPGV
jgi:carbamoyl-phosphate synthase small subunit